MSQGIGATHPILGVSDVFGGHYYSPLDYAGSASYVQGGDSIGATSFGFNSSIQTLIGSVSHSGTYRVDPRPLTSGIQTQWQLVWIVVATGLEVAGAVNLSGETVRLSAIGY
jgi:hypothetical protein